MTVEKEEKKKERREIKTQFPSVPKIDIEVGKGGL